MFAERQFYITCSEKL